MLFQNGTLSSNTDTGSGSAEARDMDILRYFQETCDAFRQYW